MYSGDVESSSDRKLAKQKKKTLQREEDCQRAQLELLMMDKDQIEEGKGYILKELVEVQKIKSGKKKAKYQVRIVKISSFMCWFKTTSSVIS